MFAFFLQCFWAIAAHKFSGAGFQYFSLVQEDFGGQLSATGFYQRFREGPDFRTSDR